MNESSSSSGGAGRMQSYLKKIATGPKMSKDLTAAEAEDGLSLVLSGQVSPVRAALFLIAARMKLETVEENIGFWRALDRTTVQQTVNLPRLLQVADAFDGFNRVPYFGFYTIPVLAAMGLPAYGHSTLPLPPKFGITFEDMLVNHYQASPDHDFATRQRLLEQHGFGYISTQQTHPKLDALKDLRAEIVKRPMLSMMEKMLMPLKAKTNFLATNFFHPGYVRSMLAAAELGGWQKTVIGNGMEGSALYGVHKATKLYILPEQGVGEEQSLAFSDKLNPAATQQITEAFESLKETEATRENLVQLGERALRGLGGPAAPLIAWQAATFGHLFDVFPQMQSGYETTKSLLHSGACYGKLMNYLMQCG